MSNIYRNQTYLRIELNCGISIADADPVMIQYRKPSGTTGSVVAGIGDANTGLVHYDVTAAVEGQPSFLDEAGTWRFWTFVTLSDGRTARGETYLVEVQEETK